MRGFERIMPTLLPYDADDDEAAEQYVREALRRSQRGNWTALLADNRVMQTYRVLRRIEAGAAQAHIRHRESIRQAEIDRDAGVISDEEFAENYRDFAGWRRRAAVFDGFCGSTWDMAPDRVRVVRRDQLWIACGAHC